MKLIFKVEINSKEWDNETFDDSKFDKKTLKSMLFDEFYDTLTDIMNVNDFSDNIKYISSNKTDKTSIQHLKTEGGNIIIVFLFGKYFHKLIYFKKYEN